MKRCRLRWPWTDGLAGRFTLLLATALLAANAVALFLLGVERERLGRAAYQERQIDRIVGLVPALEVLDAGLRRSVASEASTRDTLFSVDRTPLARRSDVTAPAAAALARQLIEKLPDRDVRVALREGAEPPRRVGQGASPDSALTPPARRLARRGPSVLISIALHDAFPRVDSNGSTPLHRWLNVVARGARESRRGVPEGVLLLVLGLSLIAVLGVGLLFIRRLTQPLGAMAAAARAAGRGDRSVRVPEQGARELREAAAAFNDMQARIARFDAERMRVLAAVGHDLRTPITSLRIRAEMLDETAREPIVRTLDELAVMADGLLAYARGERETEALQRVELKPLLERLSEERGASFTAHAHAVVEGRPVALGRAIGNLIDNALRYGKTARVYLSVRDQAELSGAVIEIDDDGPGIAPERLETVFEPFVRGESSRSSETGGAGLGLAIARAIVRAHGGLLELENRDTGGLRARVVLPLKKSAHAE